MRSVSPSVISFFRSPLAVHCAGGICGEYFRPAKSLLQPNLRSHNHRRIKESPTPALLADIFIPQVSVVAYELPHHLNAFGILHDCEIHAVLAEQFFGTHEILILSDDHSRDSIQQTGSGTHHAWTQRTDQSQL